MRREASGTLWVLVTLVTVVVVVCVTVCLFGLASYEITSRVQ